MKKIIILLLSLVALPNITCAEEIYHETPYGLLALDSINSTYIKTSLLNGVPVNEEITEDEYNGVINPLENGIQPLYFIETTYKRLDAYSYVLNSTDYYLKAKLTWKLLPSVRSYDVFALMTPANAYVIADTQGGEQYYISNGTLNSVIYSSSGTNIVKMSDGFGISMNLVDGATGYEMYIDCIIRATNSNNIKVNVSYQHATQNVSLATSKSYDISSVGLGDVIDFNGTISNYYDYMPGTYFYIEQ